MKILVCLYGYDEEWEEEFTFLFPPQIGHTIIWKNTEYVITNIVFDMDCGRPHVLVDYPEE